jgi:hypothetical protein
MNKRNGVTGSFINDPFTLWEYIGCVAFLVNTFLFPGPSSVGYTDFVTEGWRRVNRKAPSTEMELKARELEIRPVLKNNTEVRLVWQ